MGAESCHLLAGNSAALGCSTPVPVGHKWVQDDTPSACTQVRGGNTMGEVCKGSSHKQVQVRSTLALADTKK